MVGKAVGNMRTLCTFSTPGCAIPPAHKHQTQAVRQHSKFVLYLLGKYHGEPPDIMLIVSAIGMIIC